MSNTIINIENISKKYLIGKGQSGSLRETLSNTFRKTLGQKEIDTEEFWALRDINFEVKQGDAVGIIGRNGAGKSTLLKLLSKITYPTTGRITTNGRISSLLEVGTGFHPELTGRENIFLNGTILGMTRKEVKSKFDEIVDFSGIERFLDTPVKRYSSGMYVRLAFAVAAHLEPEILIIDEVLAVGDIEFQKKCLGKMGEVAKGGRTVIFVSHNMGAIRKLCNKAFVLEKGNMKFQGSTNEALHYYLDSSLKNSSQQMNILTDTNTVELRKFKVFKDNKELKRNQSLFLGESLKLELSIYFKENVQGFCISMNIMNANEEFISHISHEDGGLRINKFNKGEVLNVTVETDKLMYIPGNYNFSLWLGIYQVDTLLLIDNIYSFNIEQGSLSKRSTNLPPHSRYYLHTNWHLK